MPNTSLYTLPYAAPGDPADGAGNEQSMMSATELAIRGQLAYVTSNQTFTSTTTLANVTQIVLPVAANATYRFELFLNYGALAAAGIKIGWTVPAAASMVWTGRNLDSSVTTASLGSGNFAELTAASSLSLGVSTLVATQLVAMPTGLIITAGTAGVLQLQAAQTTSNGTGSVVYANTHLRMWRII